MISEGSNTFEIKSDDNLLVYRDGKWVSVNLPSDVIITVERIVDNSTLDFSSERYKLMQDSIKKYYLEIARSVSNLYTTVNGWLPIDCIDSSRTLFMKVFSMGYTIT